MTPGTLRSFTTGYGGFTDAGIALWLTCRRWLVDWRQSFRHIDEPRYFDNAPAAANRLRRKLSSVLKVLQNR
jgi:hypothetical protein